MPDPYMELIAKERKRLEPPPDGWFTDISGHTGGQPQTEAEAQWIREFIARNGRAPTVTEAAGSKNPFDQSAYLSGSTPREMGFKTPGEFGQSQPFGLSYGPWSGSMVKPGGVVTTDNQGRPLYRLYSNYNNMPNEGAIQQGRFITPPGESPLVGSNTSRFGTMEGVYPESLNLGTPGYKPPDQRQFDIGQPKAPERFQETPYTPLEVDQGDAYVAKVADYATENLAKDDPILDQIKSLVTQQISAGNMYEVNSLQESIDTLKSQLSPIYQDLLASGQDAYSIEYNKEGKPVKVTTPDIADIYDQIVKNAKASVGNKNDVVKTGNPFSRSFYNEAMAHPGGQAYQTLMSELQQENAKNLEELNKLNETGWKKYQNEYEQYISEMAGWGGEQAKMQNVGNAYTENQFKQNVAQTDMDAVQQELVQYIYNNNFSDAAKADLKGRVAFIFAEWMNRGKPGTLPQFIKVWYGEHRLPQERQGG
jgi:hypothetical protein